MVPRVVVVSRPTELTALIHRHGTRSAAQFFLASRGQDLSLPTHRHERFEAAMKAVMTGLPRTWRRASIDRADLDRFLFEPGDLVVPIGQDGLVANVAKYLTGQPVIGVNPDPEHQAGVLVQHDAERAVGRLLQLGAGTKVPRVLRTMVEGVLDDGQRLRALNEIFVGHRSHQSARYRIGFNGAVEVQSSSGILVSTGTGATGWASSVHRRRETDVVLPGPEEGRLVFFVREAWASPVTGVGLVDGSFAQGLSVVSEMPDGGVLFGDGIEDDALVFGWGQRLDLRIADDRLCLVG